MKLKALIALRIFLIFSILGCKKSAEDVLLGNWELDKLIINGRDTTIYIKQDSICYGYTEFRMADNGDYQVIQLPFYHGVNFQCMQQGEWYANSHVLNLRYFASSVNVGPYLSDEQLLWEIKVLTKNYLELFINYHSVPCILTYKKK